MIVSANYSRTKLIEPNLGLSDFPITASSHCWFAREKSVYSPVVNKTWIGQVRGKVNPQYSQSVIEIDNATGKYYEFRLGSLIQKDDHNEPSILIKASDSKLFACYSEHSGAFVRYRSSVRPLDASAWTPEVAIDPNPDDNASYTYPSCFEDAAGNIYIFVRSFVLGTVIGGWSYVKSTDGGQTFGSWTNFYGAPYLTTAQDQNNKDIIHFTASGPHPIAQITDNSITHFYFNCGTNTWHKSDGTNVTSLLPILEYYSTSGGPHPVALDDCTVIKANTLPTICWVEDIIIDSNGRPRVLMLIEPDARNNNYLNKELWYSEWNGTAWTTPVMMHQEISGYMATDPEDVSYSPLACFFRGDPDIIIASRKVSGGVCEIFKLTRLTSSTFSEEAITSGSSVDQWRPFSVNAPQNNVFWLNKTSYPHYLNSYNQELKIDTV